MRSLTEEDVSEDYVSWLNDPAINRYLETRFYTQNHASVVDFVGRHKHSSDSYLLKITEKTSGCHIGNIKLGPINQSHKSSQISLFIGATSHHGKGLATEAIRAVTAWAFRECGLHRIEAGCYADNLGSLKAFLRAGYVVEGFRREAVISSDGRRTGSFWFAKLSGDGGGNDG